MVEPGLFEDVSMFQVLGKSSDIVQKEFFYVTGSEPKTESGSTILRPEGTTSVARLLKDSGLINNTSVRVGYASTMARYSRPQKKSFTTILPAWM